MLAPLLAASLALTPTPLYDSGALKQSTCREQALIDGGVPRAKEYLSGVLACMEASWSGHFKRAGLPYEKPKVRFFDEPQDRVCGGEWPHEAAAFYCTNTKTLVFPLEGQWIEGRTDLYPLKVAAHEYGHHVQQMAGIRRSYARLVRSRPSRTTEYDRRFELQADCLAGVFIAGVWKSLDRTKKDWTDLVDAVRAAGDAPDYYPGHGKAATRAYWIKRGFSGRSPSACDTWSATAAKVS